MTPKENILKLAEDCNAIRFRVSQWHSLHIYPDETYFSVEQLESFYRAAFAKGFAAGQTEMRERAAYNVSGFMAPYAGLDNRIIFAQRVIRALPVGENE